MTHRHPLDPPAQHKAAETLGSMVADGRISEQEARKTMAMVVRVAFQNAPNVDPAGLRMRLVHAAQDSRKATELAAVRRLREQERDLAAIAESVLRDGGSDADAGRAMLERVRTMDPLPPVEVGEAALKLARWRVRNGG
jgi:polyhydroxyalkanoate synthesis regulator phasin